MTVYAAGAHARVQRMISVVKLTVLEVYTTEEQRSVVRFLWTKGLNAKEIHNEMFPFYCEKCLSRKEVRNWVENVANISLMTKKLKRRCGNG
jgi:hypothetical protein